MELFSDTLNKNSQFYAWWRPVLVRAILLLLPLNVLSSFASAQESGQSNLQLRTVARVPQSRVQPGQVLVLRAAVANVGKAAAEGIVVATVDGVADKQSARRVQVRPEALEQFDIYVQLPESIAGKSSVEAILTLYVNQGGTEVIQDRAGQPSEYKMTLSVEKLPTKAALVMDPDPPRQPEWHWPEAAPFGSYELAIASRIDAGNLRESANFDAKILPLNLSDWNAIDLTVVSEPRAFDDAAATEALKRFVLGGGKLWIMLDRVPSERIRPLLGVGQTCETIDEIELNNFTVDVVGGNTPISEQDRSVSSYRPMKMKRVVQNGGRVSHRINGWPAAIWMPVGYGEILITTLDAEAWIEKRDPPILDNRRYAQYASRMWANQLALDINSEALDKPLPKESNYPLQQIGTPVVPKPWIAIALTGFCLSLAAVGAWRIFAGDLSMLGLIAPAVALVVSGGLFLLSTYVRRDIPESVSKLQVIQVVEDGSAALVHEQAAVHIDSSESMSLVSDMDGRARVANQVQSGVQRFEMNGFQKWQLSNSAWPTGTWRYTSDYAISTEDKIVDARLTENGVELSLPPLPSPLEDPVLNFAVGDPMLCSPSGDKWIADGSLQADGERWISGTLISSEQQRRLEIYQEFFTPNDRVKRLGRVLYGWTQLWPDSPTWTKELAQKGSALVGLPVRLQRPDAGATIYVPHSMVQLRRQPDEVGTTFAYSDTTGKWAQELTMAVNANLQLVLPQEIVPFDATQIDFELDMTAPQRTVRLLVRTAEGLVEIASISNPSIPWSGTSSDPSVLAAARDGIIDVVLEVSDRSDASSAGSGSVVSWQVDRLHASFRGARADAK